MTKWTQDQKEVWLQREHDEWERWEQAHSIRVFLMRICAVGILVGVMILGAAYI